MARWTKPVVVIIDLEATCWEGNPPLGQMNEIIEIGVCQFHFISGEITDKQSLLVKPVDSTVSEYCTHLTTITTELLLTEGKSFSEQLIALNEQYRPQQKIFASYGDYDKNMLIRQCTRLRLDNPMAHSIHLNVKTLFAIKHKLQKEVGLDKALNIAGITLEGTHHRGHDDAYNIAKLLKSIM